MQSLTSCCCRTREQAFRVKESRQAAVGVTGARQPQPLAGVLGWLWRGMDAEEILHASTRGVLVLIGTARLACVHTQCAWQQLGLMLISPSTLL